MSQTADVVGLVQELIRNRCVNNGDADSGGEDRNARLIESYLEGPGVELERITSAPGRSSVIARLEGTDPSAPSLCLLGHTDVVPANEARWERDPFGGELVDGWVWGRGAIDMFNLTASMAVAFRRLARSGFRPRGTLIYAAVADEESGGRHGAAYLAEHHPEAVCCDYVITESGGMPLPSATGIRLPVLSEEKGAMWSRIRVHGTPGHGSIPYPSDNALVKAAEVVRRLAAFHRPPRLDETWRRFVEGLGFPDELAGPLLREEGFDDMVLALPPGLARMAHACTHTTIAPTIMHGGTKVNVIPDTVDLELDIRALPGDGAAEVRALVVEALGDLADAVDIAIGPEELASSSAVETPLWDAMTKAARAFYEDATLVP
ncbi:MAG TPA: M20/M25/M40 family metallo-hydrolase, partial [Acidimicrobiales bacterium]|nr:M20/M25/M40 family metallo-hydrolase [Acidimicrobiales bacterium]